MAVWGAKRKNRLCVGVDDVWVIQRQSVDQQPHHAYINSKGGQFLDDKQRLASDILGIQLMQLRESASARLVVTKTNLRDVFN